MQAVRREELWVGACVEAALPGVRVSCHDDGSRLGLYDLDLRRDGVPFAAMEVTAAADAIELWNLVNGSGERWIEDGLVGGWSIAVLPITRVKRLRSELPGLLRTLEAVGRGSVREAADDALDDLGVVWRHRSATDHPGSTPAGGTDPAVGSG
ncbi:MAG: hypothetical protein ACRCZD_11915 [Phycicoccus sp.]